MPAITGSLVRFRPLRVWLFVEPRRGGVAQMVERSLSMREVQGSIPCISMAFWHHKRVGITKLAMTLRECPQLEPEWMYNIVGCCVARWPSGLRRCVKAAISSEAWVRTPPSSLFCDSDPACCAGGLCHTRGRVAQWKSVGPRIQRLQVRVLPRSMLFPYHDQR